MSIESLLGPIVIALFVLALALEVALPREKMPPIKAWRVIGIAFFAINAAVNIGLPLALPMGFIESHSLLPGKQLGVAGGFIVGVVAWEFSYYWLHRAEHCFDLLWRVLHQIHHSPRRVDAAGFAFGHPLDLIVSTALSLLILTGLLGLDPRASAWVGLYVAVAALVQHTNIHTPRWLEWFMQRPEAHARHHEYGQHAGNYADWPLLDKLFGTYRAPAPLPIQYGFDAPRAARFGAMLMLRDVHRGGAPMPHHE